MSDVAGVFYDTSTEMEGQYRCDADCTMLRDEGISKLEGFMASNDAGGANMFAAGQVTRYS